MKDKVGNIFGEIGLNVNDRDIQICHRLREKERTIVKFVDRKDCTNMLSVEKDVKYLDPSKLSFSKGAKIVISYALLQMHLE